MAGNGHHVFGLEDGGLFENLAAHFGERQPVGRRIEAVEPAGRLDRLERHAAHAGLLQREVDDPADLAVVQALLQRHDQRGRDAERVQPLERALAHLAKIGAAQLPSAASRSKESNCRYTSKSGM